MINYLYGTLIVASFVLIYFAIKQYQKTVNLIDVGVKTTAEVIDLITVSDSDGGDKYKPVFGYYDQSNTKKKFKSNVSSRPPAYNIGDQVQIIYNPKNSNEAKIVSYWGLYRWTIILLSIAIPLLIIAGGYFLYIRE